jgi:tetrahedral aminopeptidase
MSGNIQDLIKRLSETPGPSGQEGPVREAIAQELKSCCRELKEDPLGNLIAKVGADDGYRVGLLAHMDEVGLMVNRISDGGLIGFELVGSIDDRSLLASEVDLMTIDGKLIRGVIGNKSRHLQKAGEAGLKVSYDQLWIDTGCRSRDEVLKQGIEIGCGIVFATRFCGYPNGALLGKALDNRIGCAVLIETLKSLRSSLKSTTLYGMFTVQEEIGAKGARVVAFDSRPQMTLTLDTVPTENPEKVGPHEVDIDRGPVIRLFDWHPSTKLGMVTHPAIKARLLKIAREGKVKHQVDVLAKTFLDSSHAHLTAGGIPGGSICFPRRYAHSPVELGHLNDIRNGLELLTKFIKSLDRDPILFGKVY